MNTLCCELNRILEIWKEQIFAPEMVLEFTQDEQGQTALNGEHIALNPAAKLVFVQVCLSCISFELSDAKVLRIEFEWPEDALPRVQSCGYVA